MGRFRENIWYAPGGRDASGAARLPLVCRSVSRFGGEAGESSRDMAKPYWHLHWVGSGMLRVVTPDAAEGIGAGQAVMVPPGLRRRFDIAESVSGHALSVVGPQAAPIIQSLGGSGLLHPGPPPAAEFTRLEQEIRLMTDDGWRAASATAYRILTRAYRPSHQPDPAVGDSLVGRAIRLIDAHFHNPDVNVNWLAHQLGCHRCHLTHRFREQTGRSPSDYLIHRRLQNAMNALRSSHEPVARIAGACGFGSVAYFSRLFRQRTGTSPTAFRAEH